MATSTRTRRIRRAALVVTGLAAAGVVALPAAAFANTYNAQLLTPGTSFCITQHASYQVHFEATGSNKGDKFRVYKDSVKIGESLTDTTNGYTQEFRTSSRSFPGAGDYTICALNKQTTNSFVTLRILSDTEFI
jgi:hypothetical protein